MKIKKFNEFLSEHKDVNENLSNRGFSKEEFESSLNDVEKLSDRELEKIVVKTLWSPGEKAKDIMTSFMEALEYVKSNRNEFLSQYSRIKFIDDGTPMEYMILAIQGFYLTDEVDSLI